MGGMAESSSLSAVMVKRRNVYTVDGTVPGTWEGLSTWELPPLLLLLVPVSWSRIALLCPWRTALRLLVEVVPGTLCLSQTHPQSGCLASFVDFPWEAGPFALPAAALA